MDEINRLTPVQKKYHENATKAYQREYQFSCRENDSSCDTYPAISASEINRFLRTESINDKGKSLFPLAEQNKTFIRYIMQVIHGIDDKMKLNHDSTTTFYRGIPWSIYIEMKKQNMLINKSYTSSTRSIDVAYRFTDQNKDPSKNIILQFNIPTTIYIYDYQNSHQEDEVLIERNTQFIIPSQEEEKPMQKYRIIPTMLEKYQPFSSFQRTSMNVEYVPINYNDTYPMLTYLFKKTKNKESLESIPIWNVRF